VEFFYLLSDIRKLKAALAAPLDFGDVDNDGDNASEVSAAKAPTKVSTCYWKICEHVAGRNRCIVLAWARCSLSIRDWRILRLLHGIFRPNFISL